MKAIFGLCYEGLEKLGCRGNIGALVLDVIRETHNGTKFRPSGSVKDVLYSDFALANSRVMLFRPMVEPQHTGEVVKHLVRLFDLKPNDIIIVHDDVDIQLGQVRVKDSGGDGGHAAVKSILETLDTDELVRIKMGVGRGITSKPKTEHLLANFVDKELDLALRSARCGAAAAESFLVHGIRPTQKKFNKIGAVSDFVSEPVPVSTTTSNSSTPTTTVRTIDIPKKNKIDKTAIKVVPATTNAPIHTTTPGSSGPATVAGLLQSASVDTQAAEGPTVNITAGTSDMVRLAAITAFQEQYPLDSSGPIPGFNPDAKNQIQVQQISGPSHTGARSLIPAAGEEYKSI